MTTDSAGGRTGGVTTIVTLPATPTEPSRPIARLIPFVPDRIAPALRASRLAAFVRRARRFPEHRQRFLHPRPGRRWAVLFCYQPEPGPIDPGHRFTIARLQAEGFAVLVVLAARDPAQGDAYAALGLDGLIVKGLSGYDFSGYTLGLKALVAAFGTVDVLVMNDSVLGPFHPLMPRPEPLPASCRTMASSRISTASPSSSGGRIDASCGGCATSSWTASRSTDRVRSPICRRRGWRGSQHATIPSATCSARYRGPT